MLGSLALLPACGPEEDLPQELCLAAGESALAVCPRGTTIEGIDVSKYQSSINWSLVKNQKVFAIARVSNGTQIPDEYFAANWNGMKQNGVVRGVYQFFRAGQDPIAQADFMLNKLAHQGGYRDARGRRNEHARRGSSCNAGRGEAFRARRGDAPHPRAGPGGGGGEGADPAVQAALSSLGPRRRSDLSAATVHALADCAGDWERRRWAFSQKAHVAQHLVGSPSRGDDGQHPAQGPTTGSA